MKILALMGIALAVTACTASAANPAPTPQVIVKTVEVPGPQPTPQVIVKTETIAQSVAVTPDVCVQAIYGLNDIVSAETDLLIRYSKGKQPTQKQINAASKIDVAGVYANVDSCLSQTGGS